MILVAFLPVAPALFALIVLKQNLSLQAN